jgi:DNA mismatch repair ATPase MutS
MCIWIEKTKPIVNTNRDMIICGISVVNNFTGESYIFEYQTSFIMNPTTFDELERAVSIYLPSEIIFISPFDDKIQNTILQYIGVSNINIIKPINEKVKNCEKQIYISKIISTFFGDDSYNICSEFSTYLIATQSLCFLLDHIKEHNPNLVRKLAFPEFTNKSDRIILANHTLQQLNIINDNNNQIGFLSSVSSFLNRCCTSMGKRSFLNKITNPTSNIEWLNNEYNVMDYLLNNERYHVIDYLRKKLPQIRDLEKICRQLVIKKLYPNSIFHMYHSIFVINEIHYYLK